MIRPRYLPVKLLGSLEPDLFKHFYGGLHYLADEGSKALNKELAKGIEAAITEA